MKLFWGFLGFSFGLNWKPFGSGLDANVILPIRYFYIDVTDDHGERVHGKFIKSKSKK